MGACVSSHTLPPDCAGACAAAGRQPGCSDAGTSDAQVELEAPRREGSSADGFAAVVRALGAGRTTTAAAPKRDGAAKPSHAGGSGHPDPAGPVLRLTQCAPSPELQSALSLIASAFDGSSALVAMVGGRRICVCDIGDRFFEGELQSNGGVDTWTVAGQTPQGAAPGDALLDARFGNARLAVEQQPAVGLPGTPPVPARRASRADVGAAPRPSLVLNQLADAICRMLERETLAGAAAPLGCDGQADVVAPRAPRAPRTDVRAAPRPSLELMKLAELVGRKIEGELQGKPLPVPAVRRDGGAKAAKPAAPSHGAKLDSSTRSSSGLMSSSSFAQRSVEGLVLGNLVASGSFGRVFRGMFHGAEVAVKIIDDADVLYRDAETGMCLEAVLAQRLSHPAVVQTYAHAVLQGGEQLPRRTKGQGQTLEFSRPLRGGLGAGLRRMSAGLQGAAAAALFTIGDGHSGSGSGNGSCGASPAPSRPSLDMHSDSCSLSSGETSCDSDVLYCSGQTWLVMEFCDRGCLQDAIDRGCLLNDRVRQRGGPNVVAVLATAREIAAGMTHLHSMGVMHGDLSPFNVMLSSRGAQCELGGRGFCAKIGDLGLAQKLGPDEEEVHTTNTGTMTHMAPEVLRDGTMSKAADVYSFGVLLWQMWTGLRPWQGLGPAGITQRVVVEQQALRFPKGTLDVVAALGAMCMAPNPNDRPTFSEIMDLFKPMSGLLVGNF